MKNMSRYILIGMLITTMAIDSAVARRSLKRRCCRAKCTKSCPKPCQPACPVIDCGTPCGSDPVVCDTCSHAEIAPVSGCQGCQSEAPMVIDSEPLLPIEQPSEHSMPAPVPAEEPESAEELTDSTSPEPSTLPPAPLGAPAPETAYPEPAEEEQPGESILGDRYSDDNDIFDQPTPSEDTPAESTPAPSQEETVDDTDDIFGESSAETTEEPSSDASQETPSDPPADDPAPESEDDLEGLFGPTTATDDESEEQDLVELEPVEETKELLATDDEQSVVAETQDSEDLLDSVRIDSQEPSEQERVLSSAGGLQSDRDRTWTDDTARFQCEARLVHVTAKGVELIRSNGKRLRVPFSRLGNSDLEFVHGQVTALRIVQAKESATEKLAAIWSR